MKVDFRSLVGQGGTDMTAEALGTSDFPQTTDRSTEHREHRAMIAGLWGEPTKMVKGSLWYYTHNDEEYTLFMPFTERETPSVIYRYEEGRGGAKARVRQTKHRTIVTLDVPTRKGYEALDALYASSDTRAAIEAAFESETEVKRA